MLRSCLASLSALCFAVACASTEPHKCPLGGVTHITASGDDAGKLAYDMAARDTLKDGFDKFTVLSKQENPGAVKMTVHMLHANESDPSLVAIDARSILPAAPAMATVSAL